MPVDGRGLLLGQTGTGKSTLAKVLLADKKSLLVIDPKHQFETIQEYQITEDAELIPMLFNRAEKKNIAVIYRPSIMDTEREEIDSVFRWVFGRGNIFLYNDELTAVTDNPVHYPKYLRAIYTQGRSKFIGTLGATQRPSMIPLFIFSETERDWVFRLKLEADRDRAADFIIPAESYTGRRPTLTWKTEHAFYFHEQSERTFPRQAELNLTGTELAGVRT